MKKRLDAVLDEELPGKFLVRAGEQLPGFSVLQADGTTASGCWIFAGSWTQAGNQMARRDPSDPYGIGATPGWAWSWPANRRILYNRASGRSGRQPLGSWSQVCLLERGRHSPTSILSRPLRMAWDPSS
jgi:formate dehydrogenase major subunit